MRRSAAFVVLVLAGTISAQKDTAKLVEELGAKDHTTRYAAYRALMSKKPPDALPLLQKALPSFDVSSQSWGVSLLQMYPIDKSAPILRKLMNSKSAYLELSCATALYQRGQRTGTIPHMLHALENPGSSQERTSMLGRLYSIKDKRVMEVVRRKYLQPGESSGVIRQALRILHQNKDPELAPAVKVLLDSGEKLKRGVASICVAFLVSVGDLTHAKKLAEDLKSGDVRFSDVQQYLRDAVSLPESLKAAILEFVESDSDATQIGYAMQILARHKYRAAVSTMKELLTSDNARIAKAAFDAVLSMGEDLEPKLLRGMLDSARPELCVAAADALRRMDDNSGLKALVAVAKKSGSQQSAAVQALAKFKVAGAVEPLLGVLESGNSSSRSFAFSGLESVFRSLFPYRRLDLTSTGYSAGASAQQRGQAVEIIRTWWEKNRAAK